MKLKALDPLDIVVTKIGRLDERDKEVIFTCIKKFKIRKKQIQERAKQVEYVGNEENYEINLNHVARKFFRDRCGFFHKHALVFNLYDQMSKILVILSS